MMGGKFAHPLKKNLHSLKFKSGTLKFIAKNIIIINHLDLGIAFAKQYKKYTTEAESLAYMWI